MPVQAKLYGNFNLNLGNAKINLLTDTIKVALLGSGYTPNQDTHQFWSDVSAQEVTGTGYTAGGATLASKTWTYASKVCTFGAANVSWPTSTITAYYAVLYDAQTGVATTEPLIGWIDFGGAQSSSGTTFPLNWSSSGVFTVTVS